MKLLEAGAEPVVDVAPLAGRLDVLLSGRGPQRPSSTLCCQGWRSAHRLAGRVNRARAGPRTCMHACMRNSVLYRGFWSGRVDAWFV